MLLRPFASHHHLWSSRRWCLARGLATRAPDGEFSDVLRFETLQPRGGVLTTAGLAGKALLVVNTASTCELAVPQLQQLQALHERFEARGLVVLAVPSDDFGQREPGDDDVILQRYTAPAFGVRFPIARKATVTGADAHAFFQRIVKEYSRSVAPTWNFDKFLIDHHGDLRAVFPHDTEPLVPQVLEAIEEVLEDLSQPRSADYYDDDEEEESDDEEEESDDEEEESDDEEEENDVKQTTPRSPTSAN